MTDRPSTFDANWCAVLDLFRGPAADAGPHTQLAGELSLKAFGVMGLRSYEGSSKAMMLARWKAAGALPLAP